jgi:hypothetical protein
MDADLNQFATPPDLPVEMGCLIDFAYGIPRELALAMTARYCRQLADLIERNGLTAAEGEVARHGVVLAALLYKTLFLDVLELPQDRGHVIRDGKVGPVRAP